MVETVSSGNNLSKLTRWRVTRRLSLTIVLWLNQWLTSFPSGSGQGLQPP